MCDTKKYMNIYKEMLELQPEDTNQLILVSKDADEQAFFGMLGDFLLQKKQRQVIKENLF